MLCIVQVIKEITELEEQWNRRERWFLGAMGS